MSIEILGIRRLYDALGCNVFENQIIHINGTIAGEKNLSVYLGPTPPLGVITLEADQYGIP